MCKYNTIGERIVYLRKLKGYKQIGLSKILGVNRAMVCDWENNRYPPSKDILEKLVETLETNSMYVMGIYEFPEPFVKVIEGDYHVIISSNFDVNLITDLIKKYGDDPDLLGDKIKELLA